MASDVYTGIATALQGIFPKQQAIIFPAQVTSVHQETCSILVGELELSDVRLAATVNGNKDNMIIKPKVDSDVLVADLSNGQYRDLALISYSQIDTISINGGELGGLVKVNELKKQLELMTKRIDGIMDALKNATPGAQDGGTAYKAGIVTALASITGKEDFGKIEDEKIKH